MILIKTHKETKTRRPACRVHLFTHTYKYIKEKTAALYLINTAPAGGAEQHMKIKLWRKRRVNAAEIAGRGA